MWKEIENFPNYCVNEFGQIKSSYTNKILKPYKEKSGYLAVILYENKKQKDLEFIE